MDLHNGRQKQMEWHAVWWMYVARFCASIWACVWLRVRKLALSQLSMPCIPNLHMERNVGKRRQIGGWMSSFFFFIALYVNIRRTKKNIQYTHHKTIHPLQQCCQMLEWYRISLWRSGSEGSLTQSSPQLCMQRCFTDFAMALLCVCG